MRALRCHGIRDLRLDEDVPEPKCKDNEIKIKPAYVGICGSDLQYVL
jgi:threonine dehydrogenase-like Zn-dependent dehydrogenase